MQVLYVIVALVTGFSLLDYLTARKWQQVTSNTRNEVVFAHRNKAYGAYVLRSSYNKRMVLIMAGLVLLAGLAFGISELIKRLPKEEVELPKEKGVNTTLQQLKKVPPPPVAPPPPPPPPQLEKMTAFLPPVIEDDVVTDVLPTQEELTDTKAGAQDVDGTDEVWDLPVDDPNVGGPALTQTVPDPIETWVEVEAEFNGGYEKLNEFINDNIRPPAEAADLGVNGRVIVRFVVENDGTVSNATVETKLDECPACDKEALRVVSRMPKWKPASNAGREVRTYVRLPIKFESQ
ncbi:MAG: energy transducer TonB [Crocinitomicaceae bacterium]